MLIFDATDNALKKALLSDVIETVGSTPTFSQISATSDLTIDVGGDIILDADGEDIILKDGGTEFGLLSADSTDFTIMSRAADRDLIFKGKDGGSTITALTLDMSNAGRATFNENVNVGGNLEVSGADVTITANIIHAGDTNTFFGFNDADTFRIVTGGSEALRVDSSQRVGIGITDPDQALEIGAGGKLKLSRADNARSMLLFTDNNNATIQSSNDPILIESANFMAFNTNGANERIRIDTSGRVGIGDNSPTRELSLKKTTDHSIMSITTGTGNLAGIVLGDTGADDQGGVIYNNSGDYLYFRTGGAERLRILNGGGLTFNGDTAAANALDDYEEGTWTPDLRSGTTSLSTQTWQYGPTATYTKIGRLVYIHMSGKLSSVAGTNSYELRVFGLPYSPHSTGGYQEYRINFILGDQPNTSDSDSVFGFIRNGGSDIGTRILDGGDTIFSTNRIDSNTFMSFWGAYFTDS
tara:strand:+ start:1 stop:1410 length:1410 start_codon:yes stop_codon:yes gene_type:complete